jgi:hypothetical protein
MTDETKGDLARFLIELAQDPKKLIAFRKDPENAMDLAALTEAQKELVRAAVPYLAFARPGFGSLPLSSGQDGDGGGREIVVVIVVVIIIL